MRCFLAIDLPDPTRDSLSPLLREKIPGAHWVEKDQLHLTLRFLGEVSDPSFQSLREALRQVSFPGFSLTPRGMGVFPDLRRPRVLWVGFAAPPALFRLQSSLEELVQKAGLPAETRAFLPHLTLARLKFPAHRQLEDFLQRHQDFSLPSFAVADFHLYSSLLSPKGAEHRREATYSLR